VNLKSLKIKEKLRVHKKRQQSVCIKSRKRLMRKSTSYNVRAIEKQILKLKGEMEKTIDYFKKNSKKDKENPSTNPKSSIFRTFDHQKTKKHRHKSRCSTHRNSQIYKQRISKVKNRLSQCFN